MKKNCYQKLVVLMLLFGMLILTACSAAAADEESAFAAEEQTGQAEQTESTLENLLGEDYVSYLTETITMQIGNRMEKNPEIRYYPIEDNAPPDRLRGDRRDHCL